MAFAPYNLPKGQWPPLWNALLAHDLTEAGRLLAAGARLDDIIEEDGDTFLHQAARENDAEVVEFFLEHDCPVTLETFDSLVETPLIAAAGQGRLNIVVRLLSARANPNAHDAGRIGNTALREAVRGGHVEVVALLLRAGGDPTIPGWMALSAADQAHYEMEGGLATPQAAQIQQLLARFPSALRDRVAKP
jgi:ankyrin repeat protein